MESAESLGTAARGARSATGEPVDTTAPGGAFQYAGFASSSERVTWPEAFEWRRFSWEAG